MLFQSLCLCLLAYCAAVPTNDLPLLPGARPGLKSYRWQAFQELAIGSRIINGHPAIVGEFPYQAALYLYFDNFVGFCGGSLISPSWILSVAHCTDGARSITAYLGVTSLSDASGRVTASADRILIHPQWTLATLQNDISLVHLSTSVALTSTVNIVNLGSETVGEGLSVVATGWGIVIDGGSVSNNLNYVSLTTMDNAVCQAIYGSVVTSVFICAESTGIQNTCGGDDGGPLVHESGDQATQIGIISFNPAESCATGLPTGHTRVSAFRQWISQNAGI